MCLGWSPCSHTNPLLIRVQDQREESWPELMLFQEVRRADMDVWKQVTPEAPPVTVLKCIGHPLAKGHGKRERLNLSCHPALCELCAMENIQGHWARSHLAVEEGCCRCRKGSSPTVCTLQSVPNEDFYYSTLLLMIYAESMMMKNILIHSNYVSFSLTVVLSLNSI